MNLLNGRFSVSHELFFYFLGFLLILTVAITRIYLGVHLPTDVLDGVSGGVA
jgi:membrane-associated phospholipid phosphatase